MPKERQTPVPFYSSVIGMILRCPDHAPAEIQRHLQVIEETEILGNHDAIIAALKERFDNCDAAGLLGDALDEAIASVLEQKQEAEARKELPADVIERDDLQFATGRYPLG